MATSRCWPVARVLISFGLESGSPATRSRPLRGRVALARTNASIHHRQRRSAIGTTARQQRVELRNLVIVTRNQKFSAAFVRNVVSCAKPVEALAPFDAQPGFECALRIVDAGMNDAAVVGAHPTTRPRLTLDQAHAGTAFSQRQGRRQADDATPDHRDIDLLHECAYDISCTRLCPNHAEGTMTAFMADR